MSITAADVKNLREKTGAGMMDCKKALTEVNGDIEAAVDFLKKQGLAKAVKKGDRVAAEGLVFAQVGSDSAVLVEINCETDFVAKNEDFIKLGEGIVSLIAEKKPNSLDDLLALSFGEGTVQDEINSKIAVIGEKISLRRFEVFNAKEGGKITLYNHAGGKIAVLIEITGDKVTEEVGRDLAMQVAAMSPQYLDKSEVPQDILDREKSIQMDQLKESGKPENILEKILTGKLDKFAGEMSLLQQAYVKDTTGKQNVAAFLKGVDAEAKIVQFLRLAVGEGIEKRQEDFAEEVAKMAQ